MDPVSQYIAKRNKEKHPALTPILYMQVHRHVHIHAHIIPQIQRPEALSCGYFHLKCPNGFHLTKKLMEHEAFTFLQVGVGDFSGTLGSEVLSMNDTLYSSLKRSFDELL